MDVYLDEQLRPEQVRERLAAQMTPGFEVLAGETVPEEWPSLQSQVRFSEYLVTVETALPREDVERSIRLLLAKDTLPWELQRDGETKQYDLRPQIDDLWVSGAGEGEVAVDRRGLDLCA